MAKARDQLPTVEDTYETPAADEEVFTALRVALATVPDLREAYLVSRRRSIDWHERDDALGVVAQAGGRWRSRKQLAALNDALRPFYPPPFGTARLSWGQHGNMPVPEEAKAVGIRLA